jgi:DNA polymerase type B, organellar and viral
VPRAGYRLSRELDGRPLTESRRGGDRHKDTDRWHGESGGAISKWERRDIVAWDGEGANLDSGKHVYNLLANSDQTYVRNDEGLSTDSIFNFFFMHHRPQAINVIYGGSYDVNMILRDLTRNQVQVLWDEGEVIWRGTTGDYRIMYQNRKRFSLWRYQGNTANHEPPFILWDVLGYFQSTFVVACRKWLGNLPILDEIEKMKHARSTFRVENIGEIIEYNQHECDLLVKLMESLFEAMDEGGIRLKRYDGAGSIAAALLNKYGILDYMGEPSDEVKRWAQYAYSGGWIEAMKVGNETSKTIYRDDINSAYPYSALSLPSYHDATWRLDTYWDGSDHSLVHVKWHFKEAPFYPLFFREPDGSILHPRWGEGIYYGVEIANLFKYHSRDEFQILGAYNVDLMDDVMPFAFIDEVYNLRMHYKKMGSMASEALKLGMNSIYGKLAQQAGYRNGRIPQYHNLLWAGEITARTRAQLYDAAMQRPDSVIAFATDAIISTDELCLTHGTTLGAWSPETFTGITIIQPGVYFLQASDNWFDKYRGFDKGSLLRAHIVASWKLGFTHYEASLTRFITMGSALNRTNFRDYWCTWPTEQRKLDILPSGKRTAGQDTCYWDRLCDTLPVLNYHMELMSTPHSLEWIDDAKYPRPTYDGVDIRILEEEYNDSYA